NNDDPISSKLKDNENSEESFVLTEELYQQSTALELANLVRSGKVTSRELVDMAYSIIEKTNPDLNNIVALTKEQAYKKIENLEDTGQPFYGVPLDRKSTRLNSSHVSISYAVFCLKKN